MTLAIVCIALLGLLVFGLGLGVSMTRWRRGRAVGFDDDPADPLHKWVRAHGNATEYAPMMGVLILLVGRSDPPAWAAAVIVAVTASRYAHAAGVLMSRTLAEAQVLRALGAAGTYLGGLALCVAALLG